MRVIFASINYNQSILRYYQKEAWPGKFKMAAPTGTQNMSNEERTKLGEKLDAELSDFVKSLPKTPYKDGFQAESMDKDMEEHPAFRTESIKEGEDLPPLVAAMQSLKYDPLENSPDELANTYKDDGNHNFKIKKYHWAIAAYTEGIKQKSENFELNAQLYTNRATAHYYLGNLRSSFKDCKSALKMKPDHMKAIIKSAQCCAGLKEYAEAIKYCNIGLEMNPEEKTLREIKEKSEREYKFALRDERKNVAVSRKLQDEESRLLAAIEERKIQFHNVKNRPLDISDLVPHHPGAGDSKVHLDSHGILHWPVLFLYPEHEQTDFISSVSENSTLDEQLRTLFETGAPTWDRHGQYKLPGLKVYYENPKSGKLHVIPSSARLRDVLSNPDHTLLGGITTFLVLVEKSDFRREFIGRYPQ